MLIYLLKSSACLGILLIFYKLALERENMHWHKRFYLLFALAISFIIPIITYNTYVEVTPSTSELTLNSLSISEVGTSSFFQDNIKSILWSIYVLGVIIFGFRFLYNLYQIGIRIKKNEKQSDRQFVNVLLNDLLTPHTFFKFIFLNKGHYKSHRIPREVFWHEQTHATQKHSVDILIIEFLQVLLWFNPLVYWAKNAIKLNHEFLADQAVLNKGICTSDYQKTLLNYSTNALQPELVNALNYSLIKKRFTVMKSQSSKRSMGMRYILLTPLLALLFFSFRTESVIEIEKEPIFENEIVKPVIQEGATKAQIDEYNALAKKLHYTEDRKDEYLVKKKDVERIKYLYSLMTDAQKETAQSFPNIAPPPPPAPAPNKPQVVELPPPPPPLPKDATDAQKKKYKEAMKSYKVKQEKAKFKRQKKLEEDKLKQIKLKEAKEHEQQVKLKKVQERAEMARVVGLEKREKAEYKAQLARAEERQAALADRKEAMVVERISREKERAAAIADRKEVIVAERIARSENRNAAVADRKRVAVAERISRSEDRIASRSAEIAQKKEVLAARVADRKAVQGVDRAKMRAERAELVQVRRDRLRENPDEFVDNLVDDGALFYYNDNKIQPHRAKRLIKNKEDLHVDIERNSDGKTRVYLSDK